MSLKELKDKLQKQYPKKPLIEKHKDDVIEIWGWCKRIDGKKEMGLVGKYIVKR